MVAVEAPAAGGDANADAGSVAGLDVVAAAVLADVDGETAGEVIAEFGTGVVGPAGGVVQAVATSAIASSPVAAASPAAVRCMSAILTYPAPRPVTPRDSSTRDRPRFDPGSTPV